MIEVSELAIFIVKFYLPAMFANSSPVLVRGEIPIDGGRKFVDGRPLFGSNKTVEGLIIGAIMSLIAGSVIGYIWGDTRLAALAAISGVAALMGDLAGAFIKRRLGIKPGDPLPVLDQLDFALAATAVYYIAGVEEVVGSPAYVALSLAIIFALHVLTNGLAYLLKLKSVPI